MSNPDQSVCDDCAVVMGPGTDVIPFLIPEDDGHGGGKMEAFCPQCCVWHRMPLDPQRFFPGAHVAIQCLDCKKQSVATRTGNMKAGACPQCRSPRTIDLGPKSLGDLKFTVGALQQAKA